MAKRKKNPQMKYAIDKPQASKEPKLTHTAYQITFWLTIVGFVAQVIMAVLVYPHLPAMIPAGWAGWSAPSELAPSWIVFLLFPGAQIVLFLLTIFSPKNDEGKLIMEHGKAWSLVLLALLFTALQYSAFHLPQQ